MTGDIHSSMEKKMNTTPEWEHGTAALAMSAGQATSPTPAAAATAMGASPSQPTFVCPATTPALACHRTLRAPTRASEAMRLRLLRLLFDAIDHQHRHYIDRSALLLWIRHERYLQLPHLVATVRSVTQSLAHDEDSHIGVREFNAAFGDIHLWDVTRLIINLCRQLPLPGQTELLATGVALFEDASIEGEDELHQQADDDNTQETTISNSSSGNDTRDCQFLISMLFVAIDNNLDGRCELREFKQFIGDDNFFRDAPYKHCVSQVLTALYHQNRHCSASAFCSSADDTGQCRCWDASNEDHSKFARGLSQQHFYQLLSSLSLQQLSALFVHLLTRTTHGTLVTHNSNDRHSHKPMHQHRQMLDDALLTVPAHPLAQSKLVHGTMSSKPATLQLTLLGQSMIQHDLRDSEYGRSVLAEMPSVIDGDGVDVVFSELETAIQNDSPTQHPTRSTVFFHSAKPSVIDNLKVLGVNVLAIANNHAGDLGANSVLTMRTEIEARKITVAGAGANVAEATQPAYLRTRSGVVVGLVAHASKVPPGSEATADRPGVNSVSMADIETCTLDDEQCKRLLSAVSEARKCAPIVLVYHHNHYWTGNGAVNQPHEMGAWQRTWAKSLIDAGATIYVAHGDPRLQGIEIYNGCPIFYCLGNFVFQTKTELGFYGPEVWQACVVRVEWHQQIDQSASASHREDGVIDKPLDPRRRPAAQTAEAASPWFSLALLPLLLNEHGCPEQPEDLHLKTRGLPFRPPHAEAIEILEHVRSLCAPFGTVVDIDANHRDGPRGWVTRKAASSN